jgi:hypothetical protein
MINTDHAQHDDYYYAGLIPGSPGPAGPGPAPAAPGGPPPGPAPKGEAHNDMLAWAALVSAFLMFPLGLLFGHASNRAAKRARRRRSVLAIVGLVISYAVAAVVTLAVIGGIAGGSTTPAAAPSPAAATAPVKAPPTVKASAKPAPLPVLIPGHSATFTIRSYSGGPATSLTWTMGSKVVTGTRDSAGMTEDAGYQSAGFQVTIRNNGPAPTNGSPDYGSSLTWTGADGKSDNTLAQSAAMLGPSDLGLTGTDILTNGSLQPGQYVSGYLIWKVPTAPGHITLLSGSADGMSHHPVLQINLGGQ